MLPRPADGDADAVTEQLRLRLAGLLEEVLRDYPTQNRRLVAPGGVRRHRAGA